MKWKGLLWTYTYVVLMADLVRKTVSAMCNFLYFVFPIYVTRFNDLVSRYYDLVSRYYVLLYRYYDSVSCNYHLGSRYFDLVSRFYE